MPNGCGEGKGVDRGLNIRETHRRGFPSTVWFDSDFADHIWVHGLQHTVQQCIHPKHLKNMIYPISAACGRLRAQCDGRSQAADIA